MALRTEGSSSTMKTLVALDVVAFNWGLFKKIAIQAFCRIVGSTGFAIVA
jgi:hypothetical protein